MKMVTRKKNRRGKSFDEVYRRIKKMNDMELEWGFFSDAPLHDDGIPVAQIAKWNEEGHAINTPPRPFMSSQARGAQKVLSPLVKKYYRQITRGKINFRDRMEKLGEAMVEDLKDEILAWTDPPNMQSTVDQKGFNDPLIESGRMYDSVDFRVRSSKTNRRLPRRKK